jgi:hypothetical protein
MPCPSAPFLVLSSSREFESGYSTVLLYTGSSHFFAGFKDSIALILPSGKAVAICNSPPSLPFVITECFEVEALPLLS